MVGQRAGAAEIEDLIGVESPTVCQARMAIQHAASAPRSVFQAGDAITSAASALGREELIQALKDELLAGL